MIKEAINRLVKREDLAEQEAAEVMSEVMSGEATDAQVAAFMTALRMKGETTAEITGCARVMRKFATPIRVRSLVDVDREDISLDRETILDTCGTGGDGTCTFNVSTATALVIAACGVPVAKHGNRSVSSACGSADVLEALGVNINIPPEKVEASIKTIGIGFLFAPALHGAMKYAIGPRKQIGIRTIFNILGPLTNPAGADSQVLGVYSPGLVKPMAEVLRNLGTRRAWIVHGEDGLDEITVTGKTHVAQLWDGKVTEFAIAPEEFGISLCSLSDLKGGSARDNAEIIRNVLSGEQGPRRDIVLLNAAAGLYISGKADSMKSGLAAAAAAIDSDRAKEKLDQLIRLTTDA